MFRANAVKAKMSLGSGSAKVTSRFKLPEKFKGGFIEKWTDYWIMIMRDYKDVGKTFVQDCRTYPKKATIYLSGVAASVYCFHTNPNMQDFQDALQHDCNSSLLISKKIRNPDIDQHFNNIVDCINHGTLRRLDLGFLSLMWIDNYSKECALYKTQCSYLKPRYLTFHERIVDVGAVGRWWNIYFMMQEFDVNYMDWKNEDENENSVKTTMSKYYNRLCSVFS